MAAENLHGCMDMSQCFCLNQSSSHPFSNLFVGDETLACRSDCDGQLLINIVFRNPVRLQAISFGAPPNDMAPSVVKLFPNMPSPGFSDAEENEPAQTLLLEPGQLLSPDVKIPLKLVKFQNVNSLTIYVEDNGGADITELYSLKVFGTTVHTVDVAAIHDKKEQG